MTKSDNPAFVDTNVAVYALLDNSPHHVRCRLLLERGAGSHKMLCFVTQILAELFAVVTNPRRVEQPLSPSEAMSAITDMLERPHVIHLPTPLNQTSLLIDLIERVPVPKIFDHLIVAAMLGNGVNSIYTFDNSGFERFPELNILTP